MSAREIQPVGVMAIDPGTTTGVAWGVYDPHEEDMASIIATGEMTGCAEFAGSEPWVAAQCVEAWRDFELLTRVKLGVEVHTLVIEDFILRVGKGMSSAREGLSPVRITSLIEGLLMERHCGTAAPLGEQPWELVRELSMPTIVYQQPSSAKSFANRDRLERWGLWEVGARHARDAWRHVALYLAEVGRNGPK